MLIERQFKRIEGVQKVSVNHAKGKAVVYCETKPKFKKLKQAIKSEGCTVDPNVQIIEGQQMVIKLKN